MPRGPYPAIIYLRQFKFKWFLFKIILLKSPAQGHSLVAAKKVFVKQLLWREVLNRGNRDAIFSPYTFHLCAKAVGHHICYLVVVNLLTGFNHK